MEPERRGDSFDASQAEYFVTAKGRVEIRDSPALFSKTTNPLYKLMIIKPFEYGDGRELLLFKHNHRPFKLQPSIFRAASYRSAVCL